MILNLAINARDAMPTGGKLTIETADVYLDDTYAGEHLGAKIGPHVMLAVSDTGIGMDRATQTRIFEPFFTTKETGKGTGLGLSTVLGIAQQSGGTVWVYSEPNQGTTFKVYFPRIEGAVPTTRPSGIPPMTLRGSETILLVEDEDQVRTVANDILNRYGYHVLVARNSAEAIALCEKHSGPIHLLLTDVVMPQMSGPVLAKQLAALRATLQGALHVGIYRRQHRSPRSTRERDGVPSKTVHPRLIDPQGRVNCSTTPVSARAPSRSTAASRPTKTSREVESLRGMLARAR